MELDVWKAWSDFVRRCWPLVWVYCKWYLWLRDNDSNLMIHTQWFPMLRHYFNISNISHIFYSNIYVFCNFLLFIQALMFYLRIGFIHFHYKSHFVKWRVDYLCWLQIALPYCTNIFLRFEKHLYFITLLNPEKHLYLISLKLKHIVKIRCELIVTHLRFQINNGDDILMIVLV